VGEVCAHILQPRVRKSSPRTTAGFVHRAIGAEQRIRAGSPNAHVAGGRRDGHAVGKPDVKLQVKRVAPDTFGSNAFPAASRPGAKSQGIGINISTVLPVGARIIKIKTAIEPHTAVKKGGRLRPGCSDASDPALGIIPGISDIYVVGTGV